jgi:hypothetical protein
MQPISSVRFFWSPALFLAEAPKQKSLDPLVSSPRARRAIISQSTRTGTDVQAERGVSFRLAAISSSSFRCPLASVSFLPIHKARARLLYPFALCTAGQSGDDNFHSMPCHGCVLLSRAVRRACERSASKSIIEHVTFESWTVPFACGVLSWLPPCCQARLISFMTRRPCPRTSLPPLANAPLGFCPAYHATCPC